MQRRFLRSRPLTGYLLSNQFMDNQKFSGPTRSRPLTGYLLSNHKKAFYILLVAVLVPLRGIYYPIDVYRSVSGGNHCVLVPLRGIYYPIVRLPRPLAAVPVLVPLRGIYYPIK